MSTIREITSEVLTDINARNIDEYVSRRYIYSKLRDKAKTLIKQENLTRLYNQMSLFTTVPCVQMVTMPTVDCCSIDLPSVDSIQRSKLKLPELYETTFGKYLITVRDVLNTRTYIPITPQQYQSLILLDAQDKSLRYFWIENGYLFIPDSDVEIVVITGLFPDPEEARALNSCDTSSKKKSICESFLDRTFICPDYLISIVKDQTLEVILNGFKRVQPDNRPDSNTNQR
jgi:hypothetical protein